MSVEAPRILSDETSDGVRTIALPHWRDFHALMIEKSMLRSGLIWRGQRRGWPLLPRLDRDFPPPPVGPTEEGEDPSWAVARRDAEHKKQLGLRYAFQLDRFKAAAAGRRGVNPRNLDGSAGQEEEHDEWWALGQHYGLHTPLIDWTESPFAALFFAFLEDSSGDPVEEPYGEHYRYVFALDREPIELQNEERLGVAKRSLEWNPPPMPAHRDNAESFARARAAQEEERRGRLRLDKIRIIRPTTDENLRLLSQGGVFTQAPPGQDIEGYIRKNFAVEAKTLNPGPIPLGPPMLKIRIGEDDQRDCLRALNKMAINHRTLFPDLDGAGRFVNMLIEDPTY